MKIIIAKVLVFFIILVVIVGILTKVFVPFSEHKQIVKEFYNEPKNSLDVVFLGDSSIYKGISPATIWEEYKITSYDFGSPTQRIWDSYYMLNEVLHYQNPKVIVLNIDQIYKNIPLKEEYSRVLYDSIKLSKNKISAISDPVQNKTINEQISFIFPILRFHDRWKELEDNDFKIEKDRNNEIFKGYWLLKREKPYESEFDYMKQTSGDEISDKALIYLNKINELCKQNNIELILIEMPTPNVWDKTKHEQILELSETENIVFIDTNVLLDEIKIDWEKDTSDYGDHLNLNGAEKVSKYIGQYLNENYEFENHKKEDVYAEWEETLKKYNECKEE